MHLLQTEPYLRVRFVESGLTRVSVARREYCLAGAGDDATAVVDAQNAVSVMLIDARRLGLLAHDAGSRATGIAPGAAHRVPRTGCRAP